MTDSVVMVVTNDCISDPRVEKEAVALSTAGYEVTVLAWDRMGEAATVEQRDGFTIERLGPRAAYGAGIRSLSAFREFWTSASRRVQEMAPSVVHCHDLDTAPVGLRVIRRVPGTRLVLDCHELYRASRMVPQNGLVGVAARAVVDRLDARASRAASIVIVASPAMSAHYERLAPGRVVCVENGPDAELFRPRDAHDEARPFTIGYIGQKRYAQSLIDLMSIVQRHSDMACLLAGGGVAEDEVAQAAQGLERVLVLGRVTYDEIPELYDGLDAVWALYDTRVGNIRVALPVKALEGMACGLPVLVEKGTWAAEFVTRARAGIAVNGRDIEAVERALVSLKDDPDMAYEMGQRGREAVEAGMSWQAASRRLTDAYVSLGND